MVIINLEIAFARDFKIKQAVPCKQMEHVVEERQPGAYQRLPIAVEVEDDTHVGLFCLAVDFRDARLGFYLWIHNYPIDKLNQLLWSLSEKTACLSLCILCVLCVSVVNLPRELLTTEAQRTLRLHRE